MNSPTNRELAQPSSCNQLHSSAADSEIYYAQRSYESGPQPFSLRVRVSPQTAKHDKMDVIFGGWVIRGTTREIDGVREALAKFGRILTHPRKRGLQRPPQAVRTQKKVRPLFSGHCVFTSYARNDSRKTSSRIYLELCLNPTRFLLHQPFSPFPDPGQPVAWEKAVLFSQMVSSEFNGQSSNDGNNNWMPNTPRAAALSNPPRWAKNLRTYFAAVPRTFERELMAAVARFPNVQLRKTENATLLRVEVYWEFLCDDPLRVIERIEKPFLSLTGGRRTVSFHPKSGVVADGNMPSLRADIGCGEQLRVYAKGNNWIRFELAYMFGRDGYRLPGGHTSDNWDGLARRLEALSPPAAHRVNWALDHVRERCDVRPSTVSAEDLSDLIAVHSGDLQTAKKIKYLLRRFGAVSAVGLTKKEARACRCLRKAGVLEFCRDAPPRGNYVVTVPHRSAAI